MAVIRYLLVGLTASNQLHFGRNIWLNDQMTSLVTLDQSKTFIDLIVPIQVTGSFEIDSMYGDQFVFRVFITRSTSPIMIDVTGTKTFALFFNILVGRHLSRIKLTRFTFQAMLAFKAF